jgi:hypothetical protein
MRAEPPEGSLDAADARGRMLALVEEGDSGDRHYLLVGGRDTGGRLQVRSVLREGKALTRLPVIPAPFDGMECCGTTKTGSITHAATPENREP